MIDSILKPLGEQELKQLVVKAQAEIAAREKQRERDAIDKIKELASAAGVKVYIKGTRGRPPARNGSGRPARAAQAK